MRRRDQPQLPASEELRIADNEESQDPSYWTVQLERVERLTSDEPEDDGTLFAVEFKAVGMSMNADFEMLVSDIATRAKLSLRPLTCSRTGSRHGRGCSGVG